MPGPADAACASGIGLDVDPALLEQYRGSRSRRIVLQALESVSFPESRRRNVRTSGSSTPIYGMCLGMTECHWRGPMPSRATRERPELAKLLCDFARWELPGFTFTSIQVNKDYASSMHVDKNDAGCSYIIGLGDYKGGQLWVDDGRRRGRAVDLRGRWHCLDGNQPHCVLPFLGRRYTVIFFSRVRGGDVGEEPDSDMARRLLTLGFPLPPRAPAAGDYPPAEERLAAAARRFARFRARAERRGGPLHAILDLRLPGGRRLRCAVAPRAELQLLAQAAARHLGLPPERVRLCSGSLALLLGDTVDALGLGDEHTIDVKVATSGVPSVSEHSMESRLPSEPSTPEKVARPCSSPLLPDVDLKRKAAEAGL